MGSFEHLRQQHVELLQLAHELAPFLTTERLAHDFTGARLKLSSFMRKFDVHVVLEDRLVYERLLRHPDQVVTAKAAEHREQMYSLRAHATQYGRRWVSAGAIAETALPQFIEETKNVFELLSKRFELEDGELYPLIERICSPSGTWPLELAGGDR
jgi:hypothetical protein